MKTCCVDILSGLPVYVAFVSSLLRCFAARRVSWGARLPVRCLPPTHNLLWLTYPSSCSCTVQRPCMRIGAARGERAEACAWCGGARGAPSVARPHVASGRAGSPPKRCRRAAARRSRGVAAPRPLPLLEGVEVGGRHRRAAAPLDGAQVERLHALPDMHMSGGTVPPPPPPGRRAPHAVDHTLPRPGGSRRQLASTTEAHLSGAGWSTHPHRHADGA